MQTNYKIGMEEQHMESTGQKKIYIGKVKRWFSEKGFGFITSEGKDFFVHVTKLSEVEKLEVDQTVEFHVVDTPKGEQAIDVIVSANIH